MRWVLILLALALSFGVAWASDEESSSLFNPILDFRLRQEVLDGVLYIAEEPDANWIRLRTRAGALATTGAPHLRGQGLGFRVDCPDAGYGTSAGEDSLVTIDDIRAAATRIAGHIHRTPVLTSRTVDAMAGCSVFFKCENLQKVGAFKMRGATNAVLSLTDDEAAPGVATHSSGNHAQALALAARLRGVPAHIVMPTSAPDVKRRAVQDYGAVIHDCEPTLQARESTLDKVVAQTGAAFVHPYDDWRIIAGQGTCALELMDQAPGLDAVITPVGGGGLLSGTAIAVKSLRPETVVAGAEPAGADDAARSLASGRLIPSVDPRTICDGLLTSLGTRNFEVISRHVTAISTVEDDAVIAAMRLIWERMKIIVEPSAAVTLASVLSRPDEVRGLRVGLVLSGGNVDLDNLPWMPQANERGTR